VRVVGSRPKGRALTMQTLKPTLIGIGLGLSGAFVLTRFIANPTLWYWDLRSTYLPRVPIFADRCCARRATRVDPMVALRCE
jgi:hypothetical protein